MHVINYSNHNSVVKASHFTSGRLIYTILPLQVGWKRVYLHLSVWAFSGHRISSNKSNKKHTIYTAY